MEDVNGKKKKFSFLDSLGMNNKPDMPAAPVVPDPVEPKKNEFYVGNVQDALTKKKKTLAEIE